MNVKQKWEPKMVKLIGARLIKEEGKDDKVELYEYEKVFSLVGSQSHTRKLLVHETPYYQLILSVIFKEKDKFIDPSDVAISSALIGCRPPTVEECSKTKFKKTPRSVDSLKSTRKLKQAKII